MPARLDKLVVAGVGLIGGSFALALKQARAVGSVVGVGRAGRRTASVEAALSLGVIDSIGGLDRETFHDASLVLLAMPVGQMAGTMQAIAPFLGANTVVTDAGSTKQSVVAAARANLGARLDRFVPAHPIAGAELSGPAAAKSDLFAGKRVVITKLAETSTAALSMVEAAWSACGAKLVAMDPKTHDRVFATVSHLPHLLAYALVHEVCERGNAEELFGHAASGFRDFTRIAGSDVAMWRDIFFDNKPALLAELDAYTKKLAKLREMLVTGDVASLERALSEAREARNRWAAGRGSGE